MPENPFGMLLASSPVEIEAKADELGLSDDAVSAALALFHDLTSKLELSSFKLSANGAQAWPQHRFYFGGSGGDDGAKLATVLETLQRQDSAQDVTTVSGGGPSPTTLYVQGENGPYRAVLVAGADLGP